MSKAPRRRGILRRTFTRAPGRLAISLAGAAIVGVCIPPSWGLAVRSVLTWNVFASLMLVFVSLVVMETDSQKTKSRAAAEDPGRTFVYMLVVAASLFSLIATTVLVRRAHEVTSTQANLLVALCIWAVGSAWTLTHASFSLRYAHLYYRGTEEGGLDFPGKHKPDDLDFAYFAFTVGMCFQVSDVTVSAHDTRRTVLLHALISFLYNTTILALALNLIFGRLG